METNPKILLVDDEPAITGNLAPFLGRAGFEVTVAADGEEALLKIASFAPDLIVLDVMMPKLDGREVLRRLRRADNWTPVILLAQVGDSSERAMALQEGADDYLNKPFDPYEPVARLRAVLRRASPGRTPLAAAPAQPNCYRTITRCHRTETPSPYSCNGAVLHWRARD